MVSDSEQREIIITNSNMPVIRSGFSNILLFLCIIAAIVVNQILSDLHLPLVLRTLSILLICAAALGVYGRTVSRIYFKAGSSVVIVRPVSKTEIATSQIEKIDIYGIPSSMTIFFLIRMKKMKLPKIFFFVAVSTNCGSFEATITRLKELFREWTAKRKGVRP